MWGFPKIGSRRLPENELDCRENSAAHHYTGRWRINSLIGKDNQALPPCAIQGGGAALVRVFYATHS
jgi:hypothetical protein